MKLDLAKTLQMPALPEYLMAVEQRLHTTVATNNTVIAVPLARLLAVRGKRLRPALVLAAAQKTDEPTIAAGAAVELLHIASLIHDDIIDEARTRWNIPTISKEEGVDSAIIAGDFVTACALREAASVSAEVGVVLAEAFAKICEGQAYELADDGNLGRTEASYQLSIRGKTAALFAASCRIGGLCAGVSAQKVEALARFGEHVGMMFQLLDDVLDFTSTPELLGKPVGNDVHEGVYTLPLILALQQDKNIAAILPNHDKLVGKLLELGTLQKTIDLAREHAQIATENAPENLAHFPELYLQWSLKTLLNPKFQKALG